MTGDYVTGQEIHDGKFDCPLCGYHPSTEERCWTWNDEVELPIFHCPRCKKSIALEKVADPN